MKQIVFISPLDIGSINGLTAFSNDESVLNYLEAVDYHSVLFSTLYQSGINYFEVNANSLPQHIINNKFWKDKIVDYNNTKLRNSTEKSIKILEVLFNHEVDNKYRVSQYHNMVDYLTKIFYSFETGTPYINPNYILEKDFELLKHRVDNGFLIAMKNLNSLIINEKINTITPKYSSLKEDVRRFEDICETKIFKDYSYSLQQVSYADSLEGLKKDIKVKSLKLFNKYGNDFDFGETAVSFIKFNKRIIDLFISKIPSEIGDFVINSTENLIKEKKKIYYFEVKEAKYSTLLCRRVEEIFATKQQKRIIGEMVKKENKTKSKL